MDKTGKPGEHYLQGNHFAKPVSRKVVVYESPCSTRQTNLFLTGNFLAGT